MLRYESIFFFRVQYPVRVYREEGGMDISGVQSAGWLDIHFTVATSCERAAPLAEKNSTARHHVLRSLIRLYNEHLGYLHSFLSSAVASWAGHFNPGEKKGPSTRCSRGWDVVGCWEDKTNSSKRGIYPRFPGHSVHILVSTPSQLCRLSLYITSSHQCFWLTKGVFPCEVSMQCCVHFYFNAGFLYKVQWNWQMIRHVKNETDI
jgi:hypothetical protein